MNNSGCRIEFNDISLIYNLYYDKTNSLKEYIVNLFHGRKYVKSKQGKLYALKNVTLSVNHGERLGIIGLNGSGKSTLLKVIAGLLTPSEGAFSVEGKVQPLIEIGAGFNPEFTGRENIYLNGAMMGFSKQQIREKEDEIIAFTELGDFIDMPVKYYSTGMVVRLAFTIVTVIQPEILLLDEMLSAGDYEFLQKAKARMEQKISEAKILIIASHDMDLIKSLTKRVIVLNKGKIIYDGTPENAVDFYLTMISANMRNKDERKLIDSDAMDNAVILKKTYVENASEPGKEIMPGCNAAFTVEFDTTVDIGQMYVNLIIFDGAGLMVAHFRNDLSEVTLNDMKKDSYTARLRLDEIPFRSGPYKYYFSVVGLNKDASVLKNSASNEFKIAGDKKQHSMIKQQWEINRKTQC